MGARQFAHGAGKFFHQGAREGHESRFAQLLKPALAAQGRLDMAVEDLLDGMAPLDIEAQWSLQAEAGVEALDERRELAQPVANSM
jgi:fructose-1,6-bisphosphatase/inositol monophosphatase family enzyme